MFDQPGLSGYLMRNFAGILQMGRVNSPLRHDYKPDRLADSPPPRLLWFSAAAALAVAAALFLTSEDDPAVTGTPPVPAEPAGIAEVDADTASQDDRRRVALALPPPSPETLADPADTRPATTTSRPALRPDADEPAAAADSSAPTAAPATAGPAAQPAGVAPGDAGLGETLAVKIKSGDTLDRLFRRHKLSVTDLAYMLQLKEARNGLSRIKPGDVIQIRHRGEEVLDLTRRLTEELSLRLVRDDDGFAAEFVTHPVERRVAHALGEVESSLFEAGTKAGMSDTLVMNLAGIFAWDVDFALDIRSGDEFSLVYEEIWQDGQRLRDGEILAAEFVNQGDVFRALRFEDPDGRVDYYTPEGHSVRKAFLRSPVDFRRVSSNFNPNRLHPILKTRRPHRGVDYAADRGTPVKAAGDGKVIFRGRNGGYGNTVILQHGGNITTLYAHLSRFAKKAGRGSRVRQGQVIGYVGSTGLASGAHLHYEYRLNGVHRNPRTVPLPEADPIPKQYRSQFEEAIRPLVAQLDAISPTRLAAAD